MYVRQNHLDFVFVSPLVDRLVTCGQRSLQFVIVGDIYSSSFSSLSLNSMASNKFVVLASVNVFPCCLFDDNKKLSLA